MPRHDTPDHASACPSEELFMRLEAGRLSSEERVILLHHLDQCPACSELVATLDLLSHAPPLESEELLPRTKQRIGRYEILSQAGMGGVGVVYKTRDTELDRLVAVKLLRPDLLYDHPQHAAEATQRLKREARALAALDHPHIVTIYDIGTHQDQLYIACAFIQGVDLRAFTQLAPRTWRELLALYLQVADALAAAHAQQIIHRDIKPENILVDARGHALLTDFGMATPPLTSSSASLSAGSLQTQRGVILGTPAYMSPEQLDGQSPDERSDQFSFCVALYESLYGFRPYAAHDLNELLVALRRGELVRPRSDELPAALFDVLERGLRPRASERYPSMRALIEALEPLRRATPEADAETLHPREESHQKDLQTARSRRVPALALGALLVLVGVATFALFSSDATPPDAPTAASASTPEPAPPASMALLATPDMAASTPEPPVERADSPAPRPETAAKSPTQPIDKKHESPKAKRDMSPPLDAPLSVAAAAADVPTNAPAAGVIAGGPAAATSDALARINDSLVIRQEFEQALRRFDGARCKEILDALATALPEWPVHQVNHPQRVQCMLLQGRCAEMDALLRTALVPPLPASEITPYVQEKCLEQREQKLALHVDRVSRLCAQKDADSTRRCQEHAESLAALVMRGARVEGELGERVARALEFASLQASSCKLALQLTRAQTRQKLPAGTSLDLLTLHEHNAPVANRLATSSCKASEVVRDYASAHGGDPEERAFVAYQALAMLGRLRAEDDAQRALSELLVEQLALLPELQQDRRLFRRYTSPLYQSAIAAREAGHCVAGYALWNATLSLHEDPEEERSRRQSEQDRFLDCLP